MFMKEAVKTFQKNLNSKEPQIEIISYTSENIEKRTEILKSQNEDLKHLLKLNFSEFWNQLLTSKSLHDFLNSYLSGCPRSYEIDLNFENKEYELEYDLSNRVFTCFYRLLFDQPTKEEEVIFEKEKGEILYNFWIIDIPTIYDIASIYYPKNQHVTKELIEKIFNENPNYYQDFIYSIPKLCKSLNEILKQTITKSNEEDLLNYLIDFTHSIKNLLLSFPLVSFSFLKTEFIFQNVIIYEVILSKIDEKYSQIKKIIKMNILEIIDKILKSSMKYLISKEKENFLKENYFEKMNDEKIKVFEKILDLKSLNISEIFFNLIQDLPHMSERLFGTGEYSKLVEKYGGLFLYEINTKSELDRSLQNWTSSGIIIDNDESFIVKILSVILSNSKIFDEKFEKNKSKNVSKLQEVFPEMSKEHLEKCLNYYKNDIERTTSAILEQKLPMQLRIENKTKLSFSVDVGVDLSSPLTSDMSPTTWNKVDFFESVHRGKKNSKIKLGVIDEELQNKILDSYTYDDEYDDSYDEYLTAKAIEEKDPFFIQNPNRPKKKNEEEEVKKAPPKVYHQQKKKEEVKPKIQKELKVPKTKDEILKEKKEKKEKEAKNRDNKSKNKSQVANHDRKKGHDKKHKF